MNRAEKAKQLFLRGYTCAQAVVGAFAEDDWFAGSGLTFEAAMKIASSFGGGMGRLREVCGAVSGMFLLAGLKYGFAEPAAAPEKQTGSAEETETALKNARAKNDHYARIQQLAKSFAEQNGSIICRDLLNLAAKKTPFAPDSPEASARTAEYYKKRPCADLCACAANIFEQYTVSVHRIFVQSYGL
ncbi:MAG: C-GCAxxG-C-C family protein [Bacteroides sp.]|nr:C-GCAxxG-C-C family protein [Prevotella sp.]MCM1406918.1 C-GCAxxG-C-C family protein [Treponema brennaborense]MCM1470069.1 C-GCAxxG-C-C family protein [Bacteroides sp.]